ncbi:flippase-like domain-containing protein [Jatrophihabitans telluris]|uniref:Flippase-like domain-containing protein n=1 Tax=Jatrophihabitans telluris TaxID=2038343 RepID=A0ABY4QWU4_9ACTN|nr:lysylphosphatidylglycerol synthase transmembrane domain-containing protein [Jatrophihabitans telluris]UQX87286.1 flippase-like domain-containing protein [Jatrophihabitans telluris]
MTELEDRVSGSSALASADPISEVRDSDGSRKVLPASSWARCEQGHAGRHPWLRVTALAIVAAVLAVEGYAIAPHLAAARHALSHPRWGWLAIALWCELGSMVYFARVQRRMLAAGGVTLALRRAVAVTFAANAMSVTLPAGPVISTGYTFRRMRGWGASAPVVTWGMLTSGVLSTLALTVIGAFGASLAGGADNFVVVAIEILGVAAAGIGLRRLARRPDLLLRIGTWAVRRANAVLRRPPLAGQERVGELLDELLLIRPRTRDWAIGLLFAGLNWLLDLLCLIAACRAVGADGPTLAVAMVAYASGMAASSLPLLPGGIGLVDGALLISLTHGGLQLSEATAGVLVYRLISLILVAAVGWAFWLLLNQRDRRHRREFLSEMATSAGS